MPFFLLTPEKTIEEVSGQLIWWLLEENDIPSGDIKITWDTSRGKIAEHENHIQLTQLMSLLKMGLYGGSAFCVMDKLTTIIQR